MMAVALDNGMGTQSAEGKWINQGRSQVPGGKASSHTFKYSLAVYQQGAHLPKLDKLNFVIVPQADPLTAGVGKPLAVKVLVDGKPAVGIKLIGDYRGAPDQVSAETDAQGMANVVVRNEGLNIIAAQTSIPVKNDKDIEARGLFTSLSFVGEAHHE